MAKNLYNLTAVTTVNDSDLLHVNQGSVSSDKKVTKQNLLKEVNSSITSLNNSLTNNGKCYVYTSPTSFRDACPSSWGATGLGGILDAKIHAVRSSFSNASIHNVVANNGGAVVGITFLKQNDSYYGGIVYTYHEGDEYGGNGITLFKYNGSYTVKVFTNVSGL